MKRVSYLQGILVAVTLFPVVEAATVRPSVSSRAWQFHHENVLGTSADLKVTTESESVAQLAEKVVLNEVDRLAGLLSTYRSDSEVSRWLRSRANAQPVSTELFEVMSLFDQWRSKSGGALDSAAERACRLWRDAAELGRIPTDAELTRAVTEIRQTHWILDSAARTATHLTDVPLGFNSFVKSYVIQHAAEQALRLDHVEGVVVNLGGDLVVRGRPEATVSIADPRDDAENARPIARLAVCDRAIATSGGYRRGVQIAGHWYSHLIDPRTARPVGHVLSATVVSPSATSAGALATTLCVLQPVDGLALAAAEPATEVLLIDAEGRRWTSPGWNSLEKPEVSLMAERDPVTVGAGGPSESSPRTAESAWNQAMELVVNLELAPAADGRWRRPFVAIWIEDKDKYPVRTMAL
jgi:thiamine biosynthesis lipoprotein ApbE